MNQQYITPCWQDVAERYAKENDDLEQQIAQLKTELKNRDKCSFIGAMSDCPTHGESARLKELEQENQILIEELKEARAESSRFGMGA